MAKSGTIAAVLNFLIWGLGYLYLGKKTTFGVILVLGNVVSLFALAFPIGSGLAYVSIFSLGLLIVGIAFAYDANQLAKEPPPASQTHSGSA